MASPAPTPYDRVDYPSAAHPQTFVENLAIKGWLRGLDVAPPDRCRVLELGCGDGFNLATMAVTYPESRYLGLDYAAEAIQRGRAMLGDLGLDQVQLQAADIRQLPADLGQFDYIIAHGVYSWVPAEVRDALLRAIGGLLTPNGVAFVSYLALPGAYLREMLRSMMRFHVQKEEDPMSRTRQARALVNLIASATSETTAYSTWIKAEQKSIETRHDAAFYHDELSDESAPLLFTDFLAQAASHGLRFVSEAEYLIPFVTPLTPEAREQLRPLEKNRVLLEQYLDFLEGRRFRQTLLSRTEASADLRLDRLDTLYVSLRARPSNPPGDLRNETPLEFMAPKAGITARTPLEKAVLSELSEQRGAILFPALAAATRARLAQSGVEPEADEDEKLRRFILRAAVPGLVELLWRPRIRATTPPEKPRANIIARWQLERGQTAVATLEGAHAEIQGLMGQVLVRLLDGTRDRAALLADIRAFLRAHHDGARAAGAAPTLPSPDSPELAEQLERSLQGLTELGLLHRE